jgi:hypothetical protein
MRGGGTTKLSSDGGDSGSKKWRRLWWGLQETAFCGIWKYGVRRSVLCCHVWQESGVSRHEDFFSFNYIIKKFYKYCTFNVICKDNAAINYIRPNVQHKKVHSHQL